MSKIKFPIFGNPNCKNCYGKGYVKLFIDATDDIGKYNSCNCLNKKFIKINSKNKDLELDIQMLIVDEIQVLAIVEKEIQKETTSKSDVGGSIVDTQFNKVDGQNLGGSIIGNADVTL